MWLSPFTSPMNAIKNLVPGLIPIITDEVILKDFGSGTLKVRLGFDISDFEIDHHYGLETISVIDQSGKLNALA